MYWLLSLTRPLSIILMVIMLSLPLVGCTGSAAPSPAGSPATPSEITKRNPVTIVVTPPVVELKKVRYIQVYGAGFTPGSSVSIGMSGVPTQKKLTQAKDLWVTVVDANERGTFGTTVDLNATLWNLIPNVISAEEALTVYSVVAMTADGDVATAPLNVVAPAPTPTPTAKPTAPAAPAK